MNTIDLIQKLDYLLDVFKHYNNYVLSKSLLNDEDSYDILNTRSIIICEITTVLNELKASELDTTLLVQLTNKVGQICGGILATPNNISNNYAQNLLAKLEGKVLISPQADFRVYKENTMFSLLNTIDTIIISKTTDNQAYLVTVIDSKELVHNVYQLRSDALGFEEFYKHLINTSATVLGSDMACIVPEVTKHESLEPVSTELNGDEEISLGDIINFTSDIYHKYDKLKNKFFKNFQKDICEDTRFIWNEFGNYTKVYLRYNPQKTKISCDKIWFFFDGVGKRYKDELISFRDNMMSLSAIYNQEKEDVRLFAKTNPGYLKDIFSTKIYFDLKDYTIKHYLTHILKMFRFLKGREDFFETTTYEYADIKIKITYKEILVTIGEDTIKYNVDTNKIVVDSNSTRALKEPKDVLKEIKVPISACPKWLRPEINEYLKTLDKEKLKLSLILRS